MTSRETAWSENWFLDPSTQAYYQYRTNVYGYTEYRDQQYQFISVQQQQGSYYPPQGSAYNQQLGQEYQQPQARQGTP